MLEEKASKNIAIIFFHSFRIFHLDASPLEKFPPKITIEIVLFPRRVIVSFRVNLGFLDKSG